jgi:hypothetical protein
MPAKNKSLPELKTESYGLSPKDMLSARRALIKMFVGFTYVDLIKGKNLISARYNALNNTKSYLLSKNQNNPVVKYLMEFAPEKEVLEVLFSSKKTDNGIDEMKPDKIITYSWAAKLITSSWFRLDLKIGKLENQDIAKIHKPATSDIQKMILQKSKQND